MVPVVMKGLVSESSFVILEEFWFVSNFVFLVGAGSYLGVGCEIIRMLVSVNCMYPSFSILLSDSTKLSTICPIRTVSLAVELQ